MFRIMGVQDNHHSRGLRPPTGLTRALLLVCGFLGGVLVLIGTHPYGAAVSPDSAMYIAAAQSVLAGEGYLGFDGAPFAGWPPLYPALLALGGIPGMDPMQTARVLHAVAFGVLVVYAGRLFFSHLRSPFFAWIGLLAVLLSWPLLQVAMKVWSELVFVLLALLFIWYAPAFLTRPTWPRLVLIAAPAALATMQRYAGLALVLAGAGSILLLTRQASSRKRLRFAAGFCLMAAGPLVPWLARNYLVTSTLTGGRTVSVDLLVSDSLSHLVGTLSTWLVPPLFPMAVGVVLGAGLVGLTALGFATHTHSDEEAAPVRERVLLLFVASYTVFMLASSMIQSAALPDNRLLSPLYVPLVYLVVAGIERSTAWGAGYVENTRALKRVVAGLCGVWLLYPAVSVTLYVAVRASYNTNAWHESALVQWLGVNPPEGRLYSNQPWVVYLFTGVHTRGLPAAEVDAFLSRDVEAHGQPCLIVWFYGTERGKGHASRLLNDFFGRIAARQDSTTTRALSRAILAFMERSGLTRRGDPGETRRGETAENPPPATHARITAPFEDGALYTCTTERATDR